MALALAAISLISAYVSFIAGQRDATADDLDARASQQWAEEQQAEQQIDAMIAQDQRTTAHLDEDSQRFQSELRSADEIRSTDPDRAAMLDFASQATVDRFIQNWAFLRASPASVTKDGWTYDVEAARGLTRANDWRLFRESSDFTRHQADQAADRTASTVLIVVILVLGLFLLTIAHLSGGRRGLWLASFGLAAALAGIVWFAALDLSAAVPILVGIGLIVLAVLAARIPSVNARLEGLQGSDAATGLAAVPTRPDSVASANPDDPPNTTAARYIAVAIAVATLLGASVGYLHGGASGDAEDEAWSARDLGVEAIGALRAAEERLAVQLEDYHLALSARIDAWDAAQRASYAASRGAAEEAEELEADAVRSDDLADRNEERSGLGATLGSAGVSSEALRDVRAEVWRNPARLSALQDASNAASSMWGARASAYLSVLAWLAVAAYLLGLSLIFKDRRVRTILASVGTLLILASVAQTGIALSETAPVSSTDASAAADAYAAGFVALQRQDALSAERHFAEAIALRPDFGLAHRERAQALLQSGSAPGLGLRAAFTEDAVGEAITELEAARANRADTAGVILNLGAMLFHRSIRTGSAADMEAALTYTRSGIKLGAAYEEQHGRPHIHQLIGQMNLGLTLLGTGDVEGAADAYRSVGRSIAQLPNYVQRDLVSSALTPLDLLHDAADPPPAAEIISMKELIVTTSYGLEGESPRSSEVSVAAEAFASILQWRATIPGFDPHGDRLIVEWYSLDDTVEAWNAMPLMSGPLTFDGVDLGGQFHSDQMGGADAYWGNTGAAVTDLPATCVRPGRYRVELYVNGRLRGVGETEAGAEHYAASVARDVGVAMCHPPDWSVGGTPGRSTVAASADATHGIAVFRVHQPRVSLGPDPREDALARAIASSAEILPQGMEAGTALHPLTQPTVLYRRDGLWRLYAYPGGVVKASATSLTSGTVIVVCAYGSDEWVGSQEAERLLLSVVPFPA